MGELIKTPHSEVTATLETLEKHGVKPEHLGRLRSDTTFALRVTRIVKGDENPFSVYFRARMGDLGEAYAVAFFADNPGYSQEIAFLPSELVTDAMIERLKFRMPVNVENNSLPFGGRHFRVIFSILQSPLSALQTLMMFADGLGLPLSQMEFTEVVSKN